MEFEIDKSNCQPNIKPCVQAKPYTYENDKYIYGHNEEGNIIITDTVKEEMVGWKIDISSLEDLFNLTKEVGKIIINTERKGLPLITIYDEHIEERR